MLKWNCDMNSRVVPGIRRAAKNRLRAHEIVYPATVSDNMDAAVVRSAQEIPRPSRASGLINEQRGLQRRQG